MVFCTGFITIKRIQMKRTEYSTLVFFGLGLVMAFVLLVSARPATAACDSLPGDKGLASVNITVEEAGSYAVWLRMRAPSADKDSVAVQIDDQCAATIGSVEHGNGFYWARSIEGDADKSLSVELTAGAHVLKLAGRDAGVGVDAIMLTQDVRCTPVGMGANCMEEPGKSSPSPAVPTPKAAMPTAAKKTYWWALMASAATVVTMLGLLVWKYQRFIKRVAIQVEHAGVVVGGSALPSASVRVKVAHFLRHHRIFVSICSGIIVVALVAGVVAAVGRIASELENATLYGGAKVVKDEAASGDAYVVFEANPPGTSVPSAALQAKANTGTQTGESSGGSQGGSSGSGSSSGGSTGGGGTPAGECPAYPAFPDDTCTGWQHTGVTLQTCTEGDGDEGDGHLEKANVTYDGCDFANGAVVHSPNVTIKRSRIQGVVSAHWSTDYDFQNLTLIDVEIIAATAAEIAAKTMVNTGGGSAINGANVTCIRCRIHYVPTGISLGNGSVIKDSYISDVTWGPGAHQAAIGAGGNSGHNSQIIHNRLDCSRWNVNASGFQQGCSSALSLYDEPTLNNVLVQNNLFNTAGGFCTYGGGPQGTNIRYLNNQFGKKYSGTCGIYGPVSAFYAANSGNAWTGNSWQDGSGAVTP